MEVKLKNGAKLVFVEASSDSKQNRKDFEELVKKMKSTIESRDNEREFKVRLFMDLKNSFNDPEFIDSEFFGFLSELFFEMGANKTIKTRKCVTIPVVYVGILDKKNSTFKVEELKDIVLNDNNDFTIKVIDDGVKEKFCIHVGNPDKLADKCLTASTELTKVYVCTNKDLLTRYQNGNSKQN